ncbi:MAG: glycosyltransferase family 61 protein [Leptolyngbyaceae cyanobacterium RU_5_1]|nr:glycosyltransferase family 61 protein [Leptolyngbyaceae cyanobacterium RU_5_1]
MEQLNEAIACFQTALQLNRYETQFLDHLLHQLTQAEQFDVVIAIAIHALQVNPTWDQGYLYIGNALQQQGTDPDAAKACLTGLLPERLIQQYCPDFSFVSLSSLSLPDNQITHTAIYSSGTVDLAPPKTVDQTVHPAFLNCQVKTLPAYVVSVTNGRVWADAYTRAILTSNHAFTADASTGNAALIASSAKLPFPVQFQGTLACLTIRDSHNYFHWMYDLLPKLELLEKCNIAISDIDAFLVNHCCYPFQRELLNLLGISDEKILDPLIYHGIADRLIVPISSPSFHTGRIAKQACEF